jgi:hypothetical protein
MKMINTSIDQNRGGLMKSTMALATIGILFELVLPSLAYSQQWSNLEGMDQQNRITTQDCAVVRGASGRVEYFAVGTDGRVYRTWQSKPNAGPWAQAEVLQPEGKWKRIAAAENADRRLEVFLVDRDGKLWNMWQQDNRWQGPGVLDNRNMWNAVAATRNQDGRLEVFSIADNTDPTSVPIGNRNQIRGGALYHMWQQRGQNLPWSGPNNGEQGMVVLEETQSWVSVAAVRNADGRLEVLLVGDDSRRNGLFNMWQEKPNAGWGQVQQLDNGNRWGFESVTAVDEQNGVLEVFGGLLPTPRGRDVSFRITRTQRGWSPLDGSMRVQRPWNDDNRQAVPIATARNQDGRLELFFQDFYHRYEMR